MEAEFQQLIFSKNKYTLKVVQQLYLIKLLENRFFSKRAEDYEMGGPLGSSVTRCHRQRPLWLLPPQNLRPK